MLVNSENFKGYIGGIQTKIAPATIDPFLLISDRWFRQKIGETLYAHLLTLPLEDNLRYLAMGAVSWYAFQKAQPHLHVKVGDLGTMKNQPQNSVALTKWEYIKLEESNLAMIDLFLENFFIAVDEADIDTYNESNEAQKRNSFIIKSVTELTAILPIAKGSVRLFEELKPHLKKAETFYIADVITAAVYNNLVEKLKTKDVLEPLEEALLLICRDVVAHFGFLKGLSYIQLIVDTEGVRVVEKSDSTRNEAQAAANKIDNLRYEINSDAQISLQKLKDFMNKNATETQFTAYWEKYLKPETLPEPVPINRRACPIL
jgi:hypothetical protein